MRVPRTAGSYRGSREAEGGRRGGEGGQRRLTTFGVLQEPHGCRMTAGQIGEAFWELRARVFETWGYGQGG